MVNPVVSYPHVVTGPSVDAVGSWRRRANKYTQAKPIDRPLPWNMTYSETTGGWASSANWGAIKNRHTGYSPYTRRAMTTDQELHWMLPHLENLLADRLINKIRGEAAGIGITLAQFGQSYSMVAQRAIQLTQFVRKLKRFDFVGAAREIGVLDTPRVHRMVQSKRLRRDARHYAKNYLEFHFGWSPLVQDMYTAMDALQRPIPLGRVKVRGRLDAGTWASTTSGAYYRATAYHTQVFRGVAGCEISVSNPNLYLANLMGLSNAGAIAWDAKPFSFVVDWIVNVSQVLNNMSDYVGLEVKHPYVTKTWRDNCYTHGENKGTYTPWSTTMALYSRGVSVIRGTNLPQVTLVRKRSALFEGKLRRALSAVSLLALHIKP